LRHYGGVRDDLVAEQTAWRNRQQAAQGAGAHEVVAVVEQHLAQIETLQREVEQQIAARLATRPETAALTVQIGVGVLTAAAVLAYLPAGVLGHPKAAAASAGLHPRQEQSGQRDRSRLSKQGCPELRRYLYLAAMSAIQHDREIQIWRRSLCDRGKAPQSATCAVAHKLLRRMMGRLRDVRAEQTVPLPLAA
jgi:transposase